MNYYIFRHGETYFTKHDIPYYDDQIENAEILPEGIPAIERLANNLIGVQIDKAFTSPYKRCLQTSEIVHKITGIEFKIDKRLHDFDDESINEMVGELENFLNEIKSKNYKNVAICSHGYPIATLVSLICKDRFDLHDLNSYPKPGVLVIIKDKKVEYNDFN